jgi:hypothetical protein
VVVAVAAAFAEAVAEGVNAAPEHALSKEPARHTVKNRPSHLTSSSSSSADHQPAAMIVTTHLR